MPLGVMGQPMTQPSLPRSHLALGTFLIEMTLRQGKTEKAKALVHQLKVGPTSRYWANTIQFTLTGCCNM